MIVKVSPRSLGEGPVEVTVEVLLISAGVSFWIYDDGASILGPNIDLRFEAESYRESTQLSDAFLEGVTDVLSKLVRIEGVNSETDDFCIA
jgi:hypothetical protein